MTIYACFNAGNRRDVHQQATQCAGIADQAGVIIGVELVDWWREIAPPGWHGHQLERSPGVPSGEAVMWAPHVQAQGVGGAWACGPDAGGLSKRFYPWVDIHEAGVGTVRPIAVHRAPRRNTFPERIWPAADRRLRRLIRRTRRKGHLWLPGGDWNERFTTDPAQLRARFRAVWRHGRIDGFGTPPKLDPHVKRLRVVPDGRPDDHDVVYLTIAP